MDKIDFSKGFSKEFREKDADEIFEYFHHYYLIKHVRSCTLIVL